jgi:hypothetical protein
MAHSHASNEASGRTKTENAADADSADSQNDSDEASNEKDCGLVCGDGSRRMSVSPAIVNRASSFGIKLTVARNFTVKYEMAPGFHR